MIFKNNLQMKNLTITKTIITEGVADSNPKVSFVEHKFTKPIDILVQVVQTSCFFNPQLNNFWKVELSIDSWEHKAGIKKVLETIPAFSISNTLEIKKCTWVNGGGAGIMNIYV
jgi:hypothetical protein